MSGVSAGAGTIAGIWVSMARIVRGISPRRFDVDQRRTTASTGRARQTDPKAAKPKYAESIFLPQLREQDHVADARRIGQQHYQPIDADSFAGSRRQSEL